LCFKFSLSHNFPVGESHRLVAGSTGGCPRLPAKKHDALLGNVIKLSGLFVRLHRSCIFIINICDRDAIECSLLNDIAYWDKTDEVLN